MITGRFGDTSGRPFIEGRIYLPRLGISGDISFLMDTGADTTTLMPDDIMRLAIDFDALEGDFACVGVGGAVHCYTERAILAFTDPGKTVYAYELSELCLMNADPQMDGVHSLLGRDILDNWRITYDPQGNKLQAKVVLANKMYDLKATPPGTDE
jgi:hypothetical protein